MPLHAVGPSILRWDGDKATQQEFNATRITVGTYRGERDRGFRGLT
jgi:hypothetical protein